MSEDEFPLESFYDYSLITELAVSPTDDNVSFVAVESDEEEDTRRRSIFIAPTDGSGDPYRLTRASDAGSPKWSPDGTKLAFIAARDEDTEIAVESDDEDEDDDNNGGADEEPESQVWMFNLDRGGDARQITTRDHGVEDFDWGPNGERIVVSARDPTDDEEEYLDQLEDNGPIEIERLQHKVNGQGYLDTVTSYLFIVDLDDRKTVRLDDANDGEKGSRRPLQPAWSPDGDRIAFLANYTDNPDDNGIIDVYTIRPDGTGREKITDSEMRTHTPRWSPDGTKLSFVGGHPRNWYIPSEVYVADRKSETVQSVSGSLDRTVSFGGAPQWIDEQTLIGLFGDEGNTRPYRLDATTDGPELVFQAQGDGRAVDLLEVGNDTVGMRISDPSEGIDVYSLPISALDRTDEDNLVKVTAVNEELLSDVATPECVQLTWENSDGIEIEGYAYLPPDFDSENPDARPTIASIHGGPMSYDSPSFSFDFLYWINQGYIVYRTNYRGSTSYGRKFSERLRGTRGDLEVDDVVSGADYLIDKEWADPNQLFVTGFSYGGITTAAIVTSTDKFSAAAAEHGIYDFYSTFGTDDNHLWHEDEFGLPWENIETYRDISSLTDVGNVDTPLLVTAGDRDWRCPPPQAEQLYVSVKKQGVDSKLIMYQNEHHNIGDPDRAIHRLRNITNWFEEHRSTSES